MAESWIPLVAISLEATPSMLIADHTGHGSDGGSYSLIHYFTEPVHVVAGLGIIAAIATGFVVLKYVRDRLARSAKWRAAYHV